MFPGLKTCIIYQHYISVLRKIEFELMKIFEVNGSCYKYGVQWHVNHYNHCLA